MISALLPETALTQDEYYEEVDSAAQSIYAEFDAPAWLVAHTLEIAGGREPSFQDFLEDDEDHEYADDAVRSYIDSYFTWHSVKDAANVISASRQDPNDVDSDLYDTYDFEAIVRIVAYQCFEWDVYEKLNALWDADFQAVIYNADHANIPDSEEQSGCGTATTPKLFPTSQRQVGYYPRLRRFSHPRCEDDTCFHWNRPTPRFFICGGNLCKKRMHGALTQKQRAAGKDYSLYLAFEGTHRIVGDEHYIDARRVYVMEGKDVTAPHVETLLRDALFDELIDHGWADELGPLSLLSEEEEE